MSILQNLQVKPQEDDSFVWWKNKFSFLVKSSYLFIGEVFDFDVQVEESIIQLLDKL